MAQLNLSPEVQDRAATVAAKIKLVTGENFIEMSKKLASSIAEMGTNDLGETYLAGCKNFQDNYNQYVEPGNKFIAELTNVAPELEAKIKQLSKGLPQIKKGNVDLKVKKTDVNAIH